MRFGVIDLLVPGFDGPFAPGGNDRHVRCKVLYGELKADLIVPFSGAAVRNGVCPFLQSDIHQPFRDAGPCMAGAKQIVLIYCAGFHARDNVIVDVLVRQIQNIQLGCACLDRLFLQAVQFISLPYIGSDGNNFTAIIVFLQPWDYDRSVQPSGIRKNNFFYVGFIHNY